MLPEDLFHLEAKQLSWKNRNLERNLERSHPTMLRWRERMENHTDIRYEAGRWEQAAKEIEHRTRNVDGRAAWLDRHCDLDQFCQEFEEGRSGELIGMDAASDGDQRDEILAWICSGGLPYALWPRKEGVDLTAVKTELSRFLLSHSFHDLPSLKNKVALDDMLLLWDDPRRNPYKNKMNDVPMRG